MPILDLLDHLLDVVPDQLQFQVVVRDLVVRERLWLLVLPHVVSLSEGLALVL